MKQPRKQREPIQLGGHYMRVNGEVVAIDPLQTDLPLRCKLALAEIMTGVPHVLAPTVSEVRIK